MKILVVSDIHATLDALEAVLSAEAGLCEGLFCLGDTIGYGPDPGECVAAIHAAERSFSATVILGGNHEAGLAGRLPLDWFNDHARRSVRHARSVLSPEDVAWLSGLPSSVRFNSGVVLSHGSPVSPTTGYLFGGSETDDALSYLEEVGARLCFCGHTHDASAFGALPSGFTRFPHPGATLRLGGDDAPRGESAPAWPSPAAVILNPGSVGFPRSFNGGRTEDMPGDSEPISERSFPAYYAVWDTEGMEAAGMVSFREVRYDRRPVERRIADSGLL